MRKLLSDLETKNELDWKKGRGGGSLNKSGGILLGLLA